MEMIRHPGASAVVPLVGTLRDPDPEVVLIRQYRYAADGFLLEIPAGRLELDEDPVVCAARELSEETGYSASRIDQLTTVYTTPGFTDERIHLFVASGLSGGQTAHESDEFLTVESMPLVRALQLVQTGEISDAKTIAGLLFTAAFRSAFV
jgi:ADP-ribose pyrophosphatase